MTEQREKSQIPCIGRSAVAAMCAVSDRSPANFRALTGGVAKHYPIGR